MEAWIKSALKWTVEASPVYRDGDAAYIEVNGYRHGYFSPCRPLNFVYIDSVLVGSTHEGTMFMYTKEPLPADRVYHWQLVPINGAARLACEQALAALEEA